MARKAPMDVMCFTNLPCKSKLDRFSSGLFLSVVGAGVLLASRMLFQQGTKNHVIQDLADAARQGNVHELAQSADWASVRDGLKQDLQSRHYSNAGALVDYYVRPEKLPKLLAYYESNAAHVNPEAFVRDVRFSGITEMTVEIASPPQFDKPWLNDLEPVRAVFQLSGSGWKLKKINAPDYLIPPQPVERKTASRL